MTKVGTTVTFDGATLPAAVIAAVAAAATSACNAAMSAASLPDPGGSENEYVWVTGADTISVNVTTASTSADGDLESVCGAEDATSSLNTALMMPEAEGDIDADALMGMLDAAALPLA